MRLLFLVFLGGVAVVFGLNEWRARSFRPDPEARAAAAEAALYKACRDGQARVAQVLGIEQQQVSIGASGDGSTSGSVARCALTALGVEWTVDMGKAGARHYVIAARGVDGARDERFAEGPPPPPKSVAWRSGSSVSELDGSAGAFLGVEASDTHALFGVEDVGRLTLWIQCQENKTSLFVATQRGAFHDEQPIQWSIDGVAQPPATWRASGDSTAVGLWGGAAAIPMIRALYGAETLYTRADVSGLGRIDGAFNVYGLRDRIGPVAQACGWTP